MRIEYDPGADAAYICIADEIDAGGVARTCPCDPAEVGRMINLDFDANAWFIGIEIMDATGPLPEDVLA
ncbi:hypothetical protein GCM10023346_05260 [Arthrobacter gyeryongensis]|uniref:DUF2283 domain-containing protein n=1 Tax=Arthrobacter gyeryongensis TaxID=1650592 RepID=A0ABP9S070_9MICC